jgi:hypothetical protein
MLATTQQKSLAFSSGAKMAYFKPSNIGSFADCSTNITRIS